MTLRRDDGTSDARFLEKTHQKTSKPGFISKFPTETIVNGGKIGLKPFFSFFLVSPFFQPFSQKNWVQTFFFEDYLIFKAVCQYLCSLHRILIKNMRFVPESNLHQISVKNTAQTSDCKSKTSKVEPLDEISEAESLRQIFIALFCQIQGEDQKRTLLDFRCTKQPSDQDPAKVPNGNSGPA